MHPWPLENLDVFFYEQLCLEIQRSIVLGFSLKKMPVLKQTQKVPSRIIVLVFRLTFASNAKNFLLAKTETVNNLLEAGCSIKNIYTVISRRKIPEWHDPEQ